ncbi:MAG: DUF5050 domain-containing protein [Clostridia bacterium]|nr:DUF5050 domain-containing protein [Clostridia bacterium]
MMKENQKKNFNINKKILFLCLIVIFLIVMIIITFSVIKSKKNSNSELGNISNMGLVASNDEGVFYNKYEDGIVKLKGLEEFKITNETAYSISILGDYLYYLSVDDSNNIAIKKVKTNGSELSTIKTIHTSISKMYIENEFIYYATNENNGGIAKITLDGTNEKIIISSEIRDFEVIDGKVYYSNKAGELYVSTVSGVETKKITNAQTIIKEFQVKDNWIYYYSEDNKCLCRLKIDGTNNEIFSQYVNSNIFNISKDKIYFFDEQNKKIASINFDGNNYKEIVSISTNKTKINVAGDTIYYLDVSKSESKIYQMYRIKTNGGSTKSIDY